MAVLLNHLHPNSLRVDGSGGDGGVTSSFRAPSARLVDEQRRIFTSGEQAAEDEVTFVPDESDVAFISLEQ